MKAFVLHFCLANAALANPVFTITNNQGVITSDYQGEGINEFIYPNVMNISISNNVHPILGVNYSVGITQGYFESFDSFVVEREIMGTTNCVNNLNDPSPTRFTNGMISLPGISLNGDIRVFETIEIVSFIDNNNWMITLRNKSDINRNGIINIIDLFDFLSLWFSGNNRADSNSDGVINTPDIFDFLAAWFND